ncbi:hypothetical protein BC826DRAFT_158128 [Russula brevipes]|nr:hypothetical protein BC826DRAFT_158128 [Russula brevipes]
MSDESMRQKLLRAARRVLTPGVGVENSQFRSYNTPRPAPRSHSLPARFPTPGPNTGRMRRRALEQFTRPTDLGSIVPFPFRFSDLPLEILQHIFLCCAESSDDASSRHHAVSPEWLSITQVCRSWRTVTHSYPPLWSIITPNLNIFWVDIMQQRSRPLLLDVHLRLGRRDIDERQVTMTAYTALVILRNISHRLRSLRLDGPREHVQSTLSNLNAPSSLQSLSINVPLWDLGAPFSIPESVFSLQAPVHSLSFCADRAFQAPGWLLQGLTNFKIGGKMPLVDLLEALRQMPLLEHFTLLKCTAVWDELDVFPGVPIPMDRLKEFVVRTESPRHFVLLARRIAIPEAARKRLAVHTLAEPGYGSWAPWLQVLPPLYAAHTRGGLQHVRISGGPTRGRFLAWTDGFHDDTARFCFELEWNGSPPAPHGVRSIELTSPFYRLHTLCDELNTADVWRVLVEGDPAHIVIAEGYWHHLFTRLPNVEELCLYPGTGEVLWSASASRGAAERALQLLRTVYVIEGKLSSPQLPGSPAPSASNLSEPLPVVDWNVSSNPAPASPPSPPSKDGVIESKREFRKRDESHSLDVTPGLMALLRGGPSQSKEVHLWNCEVEDDVLPPLCALAKVRKNYDWVHVDA